MFFVEPMTFKLKLSSTFFYIISVFGASHSIVSVVCQSFENCDYTRDLKPGVVYSVVSPNYNDPYPPGTFCRYYGNYNNQESLRLIQENNSVSSISIKISAQTRAGYQIVFTCNELRLPYVRIQSSIDLTNSEKVLSIV